MSNVFVIREQLQNLYAKYSIIIDKVLQFVLAFYTFYYINSNIGFTKAATSSVITLALAVICTFLPQVFTLLFAAGLVLAHMYSLSLGGMIVVAVIFLIMFIFYFRYTSRSAVVVLLVPLAFFLKIPYAIPLGIGLIASPVSIIPLVFGTIMYYMIHYIKNSASTISGLDNILEEVKLVAQQILANKELWITVISFVLCVLIVYALRRMSFDYAWAVAIVAGTLISIVAMVVGAVVFSVAIRYGMLIIGAILSICVAFVLQLFIFAVDYSRAEKVEYEDDDYYYYVKAIPKISVAAPQKTVKHINKEDEEKAEAQTKEKKSKKPTREATPDELLLQQSLKDELDL